MGGGHAITRAGYDVDGLVELIRGVKARHPNLDKIILEPGSAVGWQTGELIATVLDVVDNAEFAVGGGPPAVVFGIGGVESVGT